MKLYSNQLYYHLNIHQNLKGLPYLFMLHGFMGSGRSFHPMLHSLFTFCNPVTIDLIGHGKTGGPEDPDRYHADKQIRDIISILDRIQPTPLILYGYSMGGRLALNLLVDEPGYFHGAILESATCGIEQKDQRQQRAVLDEQRAAEIEQDFSKFLSLWMQSPLFSDSKTLNTGTKYYRKIMNMQKPALLAASLRGFGTGSMESVCNRLSSINQKVLLIAGKNDLKFVPIQHKMKQLLPDADFIEVENSRHRVHLDQTDAFVNELKKYINQLSI